MTRSNDSHSAQSSPVGLPHGRAIQNQFGAMPDGASVDQYTLINGGIEVEVISYGARITQLRVPDADGQVDSVVLGHENFDDYLKHDPYFGATIGRVANRIGGGTFLLDGVKHQIPRNNGPNTLHGGVRGFDKVVWLGKAVVAPDGPAVEFSYRSPDGDQGFPGALDVTVTYTLTAERELRIEYTASADRATPVNLTNHSYFNLNGAGNGDILDHELTLAAEQYTPVDRDLIPTGEICSVRGTPMDFTTPTPIGERLQQVGGEPVGYDHNFVLTSGGEYGLAARLRGNKSRRVMEVFSTQPGLQFYSGNFLDGSITGIGGKYAKHGALCLETQHFPDAVNRPGFPGVILRPGQVYREKAAYRFGK